MAERETPARARLHPLELLTPLILLAVLAIFALPNYVDYRPRADLQSSVEDLQRLVLTAHHDSLDYEAAGLRIDPDEGEAYLWKQRPGSDEPLEWSDYSLPGSVNFGYGEGVTPFPSLLLEDGTNLAATDDGVTFEKDNVVFRAGLLEGFPGLIYLHTSGGDHMALYVRISGEVQVHQWDGRHWRRRADLVWNAPQ